MEPMNAKPPIKGTSSLITLDMDQMPQTVASDLGLHFRDFIKRRLEAKMTALNHFLAAFSIILGILMCTNAK